MAKKRQKKKNNNTQLLREMSLITPAFSYLWDRLGTVDRTSSNRDIVIALRVAQKMAYITKRFTIPLQQEALRLSTTIQAKANRILNERRGIEPVDTETHVNVFLLGLQLLAQHHELKNKKVVVGYKDEVIELQEFAMQNVDPEMVELTIEFAEIVYAVTFNLPLY